MVKIVRRHVSDETFANIVNDLKEVPGNTSFRDTIQRLVEKVEK